MKQSQSQYVQKLLLDYGYVSRNHCLEQRITRLAAIINDLQKEGWQITGHKDKTKFGIDYKYELVTSPFKKVEYKVEGGPVITRLERV